jgi:hypothetical protein
MAMDTIGAAPLDVRPSLRTSDHTIWKLAVDTRDRCYRAISEALSNNSIQALVTRSDSGVYPPWVRVEARTPDARRPSRNVDARLRSDFLLRVDVKPYHEHEIVVSARAKCGDHVIKLNEYLGFTEADAVEWAEYVTGKRSFPSNYHPWNDFVGDLFLSMIPFAENPRNNGIRKPFR